MMLAVLPFALACREDLDKFADSPRLAHLAAGLHAVNPKGRWDVLRQFRCSGRLVNALGERFPGITRFDRAIGARRGNNAITEPATDRFEPANVPQLIDEATFDRLFASDFERCLPHLARRFCAMSLVRLRQGGTWAAAAATLGLPVAQSVKLANGMISRLRAASLYGHFAAHLHRAAIEFSANQAVVDYQQLRALLARLTTVDSRDWEAACVLSGMQATWTPTRGMQAAALVWAQVTGGDWRLSPAFAGKATANQRDVYCRFAKRFSERLGVHLVSTVVRRAADLQSERQLGWGYAPQLAIE